MRIKKGYCRCGCGLKTTIAPHDDAGRGYKKGEPREWRSGHDVRHRFSRDNCTPQPARVLTSGEVEEIENDGRYKAPRVRNLIATVKALTEALAAEVRS